MLVVGSDVEGLAVSKVPPVDSQNIYKGTTITCCQVDIAWATLRHVKSHHLMCRFSETGETPRRYGSATYYYQ